MRANEEAYAIVNKLWSDAAVKWNHDRLTEKQARRMKQTLWRVAGHPKPKGKTKVRPVWLREGVKRLVHDVSHDVWDWKKGPSDRRDHCVEQASWERVFTQEAIKRGWHLPKKPRAVRPAKPAPDPHVVKLAGIERRLKAWRTRAKRAATAIKKLERAVKRAERLAPVTAPVEPAPSSLLVARAA
jgi:hypothetical protein